MVRPYVADHALWFLLYFGAIYELTFLLNIVMEGRGYVGL